MDISDIIYNYKEFDGAYLNEIGERNMGTVVNNVKPVLWTVPPDQETIYVEEISDLENKPVYETVKRIFDILISLIALVVLMIPMAVIALLIVLESPGNPIYSQIRLGKDEKPFKIYKFRSMHRDAEADGMRWAISDDERATRVGMILRKSRLDELPQLWNILRGEMSLVGPRPERPEFYEIFDTYIVGFRQRMKVKPGLTGLAQVNGGYDLLPEEKIRYDVEYIKKRSVLLDLQCVARTLRLFITHDGAR